MSVGDILDASFKLLRANFRSIAIVVAVFVVPLHLISALVARSIVNPVTVFHNSVNGVQYQTQTTTSTTSSAASTISSLLSLLILPFVAGAISRLVAGSYLGMDVPAREALRASAGRFFPLLFAWFVVHLLEVVGAVLLVLPGLIFMSLSVAVAPAIVSERLGPMRGIRRSWSLDRHRLWGIMGICLLTGIVFSLTAGVISIPFELAAVAVGLDHWGWVLLFVGSALGSMISVPLNAIVATLVYFDGRIRNEGFDLQMMSLRLNA